MTTLLVPVLVIAVSVNETPSVPFGTAWEEARRAGVRATTLALDWSKLEPRPGEYDLTWPRAAEAFYPADGVEVGLVIRDLNTARDERPLDLRSRPYDDPEVLRRWRGMASAVLTAMPKTRLSFIAVGNEVDGMLKGERVSEYGRFLRAAFAHLRTIRPEFRLGTTLTFDGVRDRPDELRPILAPGDVAMVNHYLVDAARRLPRVQVPKDLDQMARFAGKKPLILPEVGAPSGTRCGSSEAAQSEYVATLVREARRRGIGYVAFHWMNDIDPAAALSFGDYYGTKDGGFIDYLATLGLRHADGSPKAAWKTLTDCLAIARK